MVDAKGRWLQRCAIVLATACTGIHLHGAELGPLISGTSSQVAGTYVWTDYAYDDWGANANLIDGGEATYPEGLRNSADIIQIQIQPRSEAVRLTALLQTLVDAAVPEVGFAIDTDANPATGAHTIAGGAWPNQDTLGIEIMLRINADGVTIQQWDGLNWASVAQVPAQIDLGANTLSAELPKTIADPKAGQWRVFAFAGLASDSFSSGGTLYDLAFVEAELVTNREVMIADSIQGAFVTGKSAMWQDHIQAAILAGEHSSADAAALVDFSELATGATALASAEQPGWYTFLHKSVLELGEGVEPASDSSGGIFSTNIYKGAYQPYLVLHRGDPQESDNPLVVFMHGASQNHLQNTYWYEPASAVNTFDYPGITVFPFARGETLGYEGVAEFDVLEVLQDAQRRLPVDPDRTVLAGFSMGGIGTYKLASLYPDLFSTAIAHFGYGSDSYGIMDNLLNIPFRADNGMIDYLVNAALFLPDRDKGQELGYDFRFFDVTNAHHALQPHLSNCLYLNAIHKMRQRNPGRVRYVIEPERFIEDAASGLLLRYDRAYWVSDIEPRPDAARAVVDISAHSLAQPSETNTVVESHETALNRDYCGPNPAVTPTPAAGSEWRELSIIPAPDQSAEGGNGATLNLEGVAALTLDLPRMSISARAPLTLDIKGDGVTEITLLGDWAGLVDITRDGVAIPGYTPETTDKLTLREDFSGEQVFRLVASVRDSAEAPARRSSSGGSLGPAALFLLLLTWAAATRRRAVQPR